MVIVSMKFSGNSGHYLLKELPNPIKQFGFPFKINWGTDNRGKAPFPITSEIRIAFKQLRSKQFE